MLSSEFLGKSASVTQNDHHPASTSRHMRHKSWTPIIDNLKPPEETEDTPMYVLIVTYLNYALLVLLGHVNDFFGRIFRPSNYKHLKEQNGYAPLLTDFETFYTRRLYKRIRDCWNRPVTGVPGRTLTVLERESRDSHETFQLTGRKIETLNLGSYNYLGFAQNVGPCIDAVLECLKTEDLSLGSPRSELGNLAIHERVEQLVARFVGAEDAMVFSMGYGTNATMISALVGPGSLIISDQLNHSSLVNGSRLSGAAIKVFQHNDHRDLERVLRQSISQGQPRTHRPWRKILVIVEGLYSMEGTICRLPQIIELKKKYKFYLFVDEAHSIGALGPRGRGVCDFWSVDSKEVDVQMGTFTKSFGAAGGYIAGSKEMINRFRYSGHGFVYCEPMPAPICQQIITSMSIIMGEEGGIEGLQRLQSIYENSIYFMRELRNMGFIVYGDEGSPVIPLLIFHPGKIAAFSREALARGLAVVVVGFPATPIITSRVRFCISAAHTREDLDIVLAKVSEIGDILGMKVSARRGIPLKSIAA